MEKPAFQPTPSQHPRNKPPRLATILFLTAISLLPQPLHAQGCTQCLDNTAATPPATQRAYRRAIILLTLIGGGLFITTLALFNRHR